MGITSYAFVKDDNIEQVNEKIEKLLQVKLPTGHNTVSWSQVKEVDSALAAAYAADTTNAALKKKAFALSVKVKDTTDIPVKVKTIKNHPVKQSVKPKDRVSFGPVF